MSFGCHQWLMGKFLKTREGVGCASHCNDHKCHCMYMSPVSFNKGKQPVGKLHICFACARYEYVL